MQYEFIPTPRLEANLISLNDQLNISPNTMTPAEKNILWNIAIVLRDRKDSLNDSSFYCEIIQKVK